MILRKTWIIWLLAAVMVLTTIATGCGAAAPTATPRPEPTATKAPPPPTPTSPPEVKKFKVAFVYVGPIGDLGWNYEHDRGRLMVEKELGDKVETAYIENVPEGPEAERVIRDFAQKGYQLIFTTSFGFMDPTIAVAQEFPDRWFVHISGYKTASNVSTVFGKIEEPRYVSGLVAGKMTKKNIIGYVAAHPIPEVVRGINAFTLGVRKANPKAEVRVVWTNTWFDPPLEKEAAEALLDQGADVIAQHQDTTEPQKAAKDRGLLSIGYDSDMGQFVGDTVLTSPIWNWGVKYVDITKQVMAGTYKSESYWGGWKDRIVDLAPLSARVPADVRKTAEEEIAKFKAGQADIFTIFTGPLRDNTGRLIVPADKAMTAEELLSMQWFVEGVVGTVPGAQPPPAVEEKPFKVAFVYVGPVGDLGWSYAHDQGRLAVEDMPGVETSYSELVAEGADAERVIRDYAQKGYNMIFATSFGYMDSVITVAEEFPNVLFEHATGYKTAKNASIYDGRGYEGWYLAGITAGRMTKTNVLGYVAPYIIPEVLRNMNAFTRGARSVNPNVTVHPVWIFSWFDPPKEREATQALADLGADVIARESDSPEPDKLAEEAGLYAIGYNAISPDVAPKAVLTAPIWDWGVYYKQTVEAAMKGEWKTHAYWGHMADGILDLAPFGTMVPQAVRDEVNAVKGKIISGQLHPFTGPIRDNQGELRVAEGQVMTDEQLLSFDWLVEGVVGTIPK